MWEFNDEFKCELNFLPVFLESLDVCVVTEVCYQQVCEVLRYFGNRNLHPGM